MGSADSKTSPDVTLGGPPAGFGRYTLLDRLGAGGMADVYLALSKGAFDAKKLVVLKRPRTTDGGYAAMFLDEARLAMRLNHPNVVQTYDVGIDDGSFFLAMEYLEGQPLHRFSEEMVTQGPMLSHAHLARIVSDALAGLHHAHELRDYDGTPLNIVHRDVSPHNIFVTYDGQVKVVDFGIAKAAMNQVQTETGAIKGKLAYMAPEHARAQGVDRRCDVYAMGVILWELIARRRLVTGVTSAELLQQVLSMEVPLLSADVPEVHPILEAIVMRALQRDPADRYATALEMHEALESFIAATGQPVRAGDIARLLDSLFATAREQMAKKIRAHMQSAGAASARLHEEALDGPTAVTSQVDFGAAGGDTNGPAIVTPALPRPRSDWRTTAAVLALAASILALAVVLVTTRRGSGPAPLASAPAAASWNEAPPITPSAAAPPAASASARALAVPPPPPVASVTPAAAANGPRGGAFVPRPPASSRVQSSSPRPIDTRFPR